MATKIEKLSTSITPFAGINFISSLFHQHHIGQFVDNELGRRGTEAAYRYSDIIKNLWLIFFCGGNCAEDVQLHLHKTLRGIPHNEVPSADTILRGLKELAVKNDLYESVDSQNYNFNINRKMNKLNLKMLLLTKQLEVDREYDFDYDNQIIKNDKFDAKRTYKHNTGYFPGVASIGEMIVGLENRDGNTNVKFMQAETLEWMFKMLFEENIRINRARMDAGSYSQKIIEVVSKYCKLFYIRANKCASFYGQVGKIENWQKVEINFRNVEVASIPFTRFFSEKNYRLVVMREKNENAQIDMFTQDAYIYRSILTNDLESTELEVIEYYNRRGTTEKLFDVQNNDFGWTRMPFSDMNHNTVFLIVMAMAKNFYNVVISIVSKVFEGITPTTRLKRFIFRFITVPGIWVKRARQQILRLYTDRPYEKIPIWT
jgi:hypothetical protein